VFDGHNDVLSRLAAEGAASAPSLFRKASKGHIDLDRAAAGGFAGGLFAVWVPSSAQSGPDYAAMAAETFDVPLPPEVPQSEALAAATEQVSILLRLEREGLLSVCRTVDDIESAMATRRIAAVLHMEGAEAIDPDLAVLDVLHAAGLRSLGPVWSRPNPFGHGVPFRFPSTPDTGPGLTDAGKRLVKRCEDLRIVVDVSHLTEAGFWDVAEATEGPLVATHSNAHALCGTARNLTDRQLDAIAERRGLVGVNFATAFLRQDGRMLSDVPLTRVLQHMDHLLERLGEDGVGLGSDYDGAVVPDAIDGVDRLPALRLAMIDHGYGEALVEKLCHRNWLTLLRRVWGG
jgi:membrane dipeptidase